MESRVGWDVVTAEVLTGRDYTEEQQAKRRPGVRGVVMDVSDGHGLCYRVLHQSDKTDAYYDPDELYEIGRRLDGDFTR